MNSLFRTISVLLLLLALPLGARAKGLYHLRHLSERQLVQTYNSMLREACDHSDAFWKCSGFDTNAGYWGDGISDGNEGIRAVAEMVMACGTLLRYGEDLTAAERQGYQGKQRAALRYLVATHLTGTQKCPDGKRWGGSWQSAMWTGTLAFGAWLNWDRLDTELQQGVERVVASEADRFLAGHSPSGLWGDTKAEENGWNLICLVLAANMFPGHPHAAAWETKATEYMMNTLSAPQDLKDTHLVEGRAVCDWVNGANVQPDFTLENHNIFHPAYVGCSSYFLTQSAMYYTFARRPIPAAVTHHLLDTWHMFQTIILPWGESAYPQGMDWELHGISFINLYASLGTWQHDRLAARMENLSLQYMRAWQELCHGDLTVPGSHFGFARHAICAEQDAYGLLAHKIFGPAVEELSAKQAAAQVEGVRNYPYVDFLSQRTASKFVSFSWKNRLMGMLVPIGPGHEGEPLFTVPLVNGMLGSFELTPRGKTGSSVLHHSRKPLRNGFETAGVISLDGGRLQQQLAVTSLGEKAVVYQDRVTAVSAVTVARELGGPLGIENDELSGGQRTVYYQGGKLVVNWQDHRPPTPLPGSWANVDGRLGVVALAGSGLSYAPAPGYDPHMAVCTDVLYGSSAQGPKHYQAGQVVARRVLLFFAEVSPHQTAALADSAHIETHPGGQDLRFKLPEGGQATVPLF